MEGGGKSDLEATLAPLSVQHPALVITWQGAQAFLGVAGYEGAVHIQEWEGRWNVCTAEWHGHHGAPEDAVETARLILSGAARVANEFRNEVLATAWLEVVDGKGFLKQHQSFFLMPFDRDEWTSRPDEEWRVHRITRNLLNQEIPSVEEQDVIRDEALFDPGWMLDWMDQVYGKPAARAKWVMDRSHRYVIQIPTGWRLGEVGAIEGAWVGVAYEAKGIGGGVRIQTAFRDPETGQISETRVEPQRPDSIEFQTSTVPGWRLNTWTAYFSNGAELMMSKVTLLVVEETALAAEADLVEFMRSGVEQSLFVFPGNA